MNPTISRDTPLSEITLRKYERPVGLSKRELVRKLCLSVGLLQPGDSRDIVVDIFHVLLLSDMALDSEQVKERVIKLRESESLPLKGIASSNIRRQLLRLRKMFFVEKVKNLYRVSENETLLDLFEAKIEKYLLRDVVTRVKEYLKEL